MAIAATSVAPVLELARYQMAMAAVVAAAVAAAAAAEEC